MSTAISEQPLACCLFYVCGDWGGGGFLPSASTLGAKGRASHHTV